MARMLVGRDRELSILTDLLAGVPTAGGRAVVVSGEAGIGKSTLVEGFADRVAATDWRVAVARTSAAGLPPFWLWRDALGGLRLDAPLPWAEQEAGSREQVFADVVEVLTELATAAPALVVLEDLHWADPSSLALLRFVVDLLPGLRVLLIMTVREPSESDETARVIADLPASVARLRLAGLDQPTTASLLAGLWGSDLDEATVQRVFDRTAGNPFFVTEIARLHAMQGALAAGVVPPGVHQVLQRRLARLPQGSVDLLAVASVLDEFDVDLLRRLTGQSLPAVHDAIDQALQAGLVVRRAHTLAFSHALVREVLEEGLGGRLGSVHRRIAEELEEGQGHPDGHLRLAHHWSSADSADARVRAAPHALHAAREAVRAMAYEQAVGLFGIALAGDRSPDHEVLVELGEARLLAGDLAGGREELRRAAHAALDAGDPALAGRALLAMGGGAGGFEVDLADERQPPLLRRVLAELAPAPSTLRAALTARLSLASAWSASIEARVELAEEALAMSEAVGDPAVRASALAAYCDAVAGPDFIDERRKAATEMLELAEVSGDVRLLLLARRLLVVALLERGEMAAVDREINAYAQRVEGLHAPLYEWPVPVWRGMRAVLDGDLERATEQLEIAEALQRRTDSPNVENMVFCLRHIIAAAGRRLEAFVPVLQRIHEPLSGIPMADAFMAGAYARAGRDDLAAPLLERLMALGLSAVPKDSEWLEAVWSLGDAAMALGHGQAMAAITELLVPYHDVWAIDGMGGATFGVVAHQLGRLARHRGDGAAARQWLRQALAAYRAAGTPALVAALEAELGDDPSAAMAGAAEPVAGVFRREGPVWRLRWQSVESVVRHSKGMDDLARLLAVPGTPTDTLELMGSPAARWRQGDTGPVIDPEAKRAYRRRLADLDAEIAQAEADADLGRLAARREEKQFLLEEMARAVGLGGRTRRGGDVRERARKAVAMRIRSALQAIEAADPALARHLRNSVSTGRWCSYAPEVEVTWTT